MKLVVLAVLVMGSLGVKAEIVAEANNPKAQALFREMHVEKRSKSQKAAVAAYIAALQMASATGADQSALEIVKTSQDCIQDKFGSKAPEVLRRAEQVMSKPAEAKSIGLRAQAVSVDYTDPMHEFYRGECETL